MVQRLGRHGNQCVRDDHETILSRDMWRDLICEMNRLTLCFTGKMDVLKINDHDDDDDDNREIISSFQMKFTYHINFRFEKNKLESKLEVLSCICLIVGDIIFCYLSVCSK